MVDLSSGPVCLAWHWLNFEQQIYCAQLEKSLKKKSVNAQFFPTKSKFDF